MAPDIDSLEQATNIVALAGRQIQAVLSTGADIIIAGRATDTVIIAALPIARGHKVRPAWCKNRRMRCTGYNQPQYSSPDTI